MKRGRGTVGGLFAVALAASLLQIGAAAGEPPPVVESGWPNSQPRLEAQLRPRIMPQKEMVPVSLRMSGEFGTEDEMPPPALRKLEFWGDKFLKLDLKGIPACGSRGVPNVPPPWKKCEDAIVGRGKAKILISYPGSTPMPYTSDLAVYHGGTEGGVTRLWVHGYTPIRFQKAVVIPIQVKKAGDGRYSWKGEAWIPPISQGAATIEYFGLTLQKRILSARCADGKHQARFESTFANEEVVYEVMVRPCSGVDRLQSR